MPVPSHESERSYTMQKKKKRMLFFYSMYFKSIFYNNAIVY